MNVLDSKRNMQFSLIKRIINLAPRWKKSKMSMIVNSERFSVNIAKHLRMSTMIRKNFMKFFHSKKEILMLFSHLQKRIWRVNYKKKSIKQKNLDLQTLNSTRYLVWDDLHSLLLMRFIVKLPFLLDFFFYLFLKGNLKLQGKISLSHLWIRVTKLRNS